MLLESGYLLLEMQLEQICENSEVRSQLSLLQNPRYLLQPVRGIIRYKRKMDSLFDDELAMPVDDDENSLENVMFGYAKRRLGVLIFENLALLSLAAFGIYKAFT